MSLGKKVFCKILREKGGGLRPPPFCGGAVQWFPPVPSPPSPPPSPSPPPPKKKKGEKGEGGGGGGGGGGGVTMIK